MNLGNRFSQHSFAKVPQVNIPRSRFDRSFTVKDTFNFDQLVPCYVEEILPGDTINLNLKSFARLAPQVVPLMDNMMIDFFFFFVPNRLVWENWERFNGAQDAPGDSTDYLVPHLAVPAGTSFTTNSVFDHMGLPIGQPMFQVSPRTENTYINALPFRGMNLIWNTWFRDQNLQDPATVPTGNGPDSYTLYTLNYRNKRHDYFTSALPWTQKGPAVSMPITNQSGYLSVLTNGNAPNFLLGADATLRTMGGNTAGYMNYSGPALGTNQTPAVFGTESGLRASLVDDTLGTSITAFRQAMMMQTLLERDARGGTRYVEMLRHRFGVVSPDFRLQRPELLSTSSITLQQHVVPQTSETGATPQGNLAAFTTGASMGNRVGFSKSFVEHGYVLGFMCARGEITYQSGIHKKWLRRTRWDYFQPEFQQLTEQPIENRELHYDPTNGTRIPLGTFGYQERYAEYRYSPSEIRGFFRSQSPETLDVWTLAEKFVNTPALNSDFIFQNTPIERSLEVPDSDYPHLKIDMWFDLKHARPMMAYGVPASLGRF
nr:MAG: major capsid protein [Microvirus sp.]